MGCIIDEERSNEESIVNNFFELLPITKVSCDVFAKDVVYLLKNLKKEVVEDSNSIISIELIKILQIKYFDIQNEEYCKIKLLENYYKQNNSEFILWSLLLLTKINKIKFLSSSYKILKALGKNPDIIFGKNFEVSLTFVLVFLRPAIDMTTRFTIESISSINNKDHVIKTTLEKAFCIKIQTEYIDKTLKKLKNSNNEISFNRLIKYIDLFTGIKLRDNLHECYKYKIESKRKELVNDFEVIKTENILANDIYNKMNIME